MRKQYNPSRKQYNPSRKRRARAVLEDDPLKWCKRFLHASYDVIQLLCIAQLRWHRVSEVSRRVSRQRNGASTRAEVTDAIYPT